MNTKNHTPKMFDSYKLNVSINNSLAIRNASLSLKNFYLGLSGRCRGEIANKKKNNLCGVEEPAIFLGDRY